MLPQQIDELRREYTDRYVQVDPERPELARFAGLVGQVKTVNFSGRALVQFPGADRAWYDIEPALLRVVEKPQPEPPPAKPSGPPAPKPVPPAAGAG